MADGAPTAVRQRRLRVSHRVANDSESESPSDEPDPSVSTYEYEC